MRKYTNVALLLSILCVVIIFIHSKPIIAHTENDLAQFASVLKHENILITEWSVYAREVLPISTTNEVEQLASRVMEKFPTWKWRTNQTNEQLEIIGRLQQSNYEETISIISSHKNNGKTLLAYKITGNLWNEQVNHFVKMETEIKIDDIFREKPTIFSCIKAEFNDRIEKDLSFIAKEVLQAFNGETIEQITEDSFTSITAYSPNFKEKIHHHKNNINLQIALRKDGLGLHTTVVVGTPIITIEY